MRICIVGDLEDLSATYIRWLAEQRNVAVELLAEERLGLDWWFEMRGPAGTITHGARRMRMEEIAGTFVRFNPRCAVPAELGIPSEAEGIFSVERRHGLHWLLDRMPGVVVNRPEAGRSNNSKPLQMGRLERAGFAVPPWLVTTDADSVTAFTHGFGDGAVYKSCSGLRSRVRRVDDTLIAALAEGAAPIVIQRFIPGADVRVHVVGSECFATQIHSNGTDYRFDDDQVAFESLRPPADVAARCVRMAADEGLEIAGLDFRLAPDGQWWCLEMNPVPTFLPYEAGSGHAIGDAVVDHMLGLPVVTTRPSPLAALA